MFLCCNLITEQHSNSATIPQNGADRKAGCICRGSGKECRLLRSGGQTKQPEIPVTVLPHVKNEQLPFVTLEFKPCKRCSDWKKAFIWTCYHVAAWAVFLKAAHEINQWISDILRIIIDIILLFKFPENPASPTLYLAHYLHRWILYMVFSESQRNHNGWNAFISI
jgi:hypothetical protein